MKSLVAFVAGQLGGRAAGRPGRRTNGSVALVFAVLLLGPGAWGAPRAGRSAPVRLPLHEPVPVTSEADPVLDLAVSPDGRWLVIASGRGGFSDLWLRSADPSRVELPRRLTSDPADELAPALSPDGRYVAYVGTGYDAKGDVYLLDIRAPGEAPRRLTGRETEDGAPCFSPDGRTLYFHQRSGPAGGPTRIVSLGLGGGAPEPRPVDTGGDAAFPAVSPDGRRMAFVSRRDDPGGDLFVLELASGTVAPVTAGPEVDGPPAWSADGATLYFPRFSLDTDRDGTVSAADHGVIWRVPAGGGGSGPHPVTSASRSSFRPELGGGRLYFLSDRGGAVNVWALPPEGEVPTEASAEEQWALAQTLSRRVPPDPALAVLGYLRVAEAFPQTSRAAQAVYEAARVYARSGQGEAAETLFGSVSRDYPGASPWAALAEIGRVSTAARLEAATVVDPAERRRLAAGAGTALGRAAAEHPGSPVVQARALLERAKLLTELGADAASLAEAVSLLERTVLDYGAEPDAAAEARFFRAELYARVAPASEVRAAYLAVLDGYPDVLPWADRAVDRLLELSVAAVPEGPRALEERVRVLREIAREGARVRPRLAMGALNRVGDLYHAADEWASAKAAYRQVLADFPVVASRAAGARFALAEILYREERYREALDLYEAEIGQRPAEDPIYRLARAGYLRRSVEAGDSLFRNGEVSSARKVFRDLLDYDDGAVEAHRGYIRCAAAQGDLEAVLAGYRERLRRDPSDAVGLYAAGLCLTYRESAAAAREALGLLERAAALRGQVEYFHQTLGYVHEVLETAYGERGYLEVAAEAYQKAYFLNDPAANPENAANLLLNLGNAYHLLGQHAKAFEYYSRRLDAKAAFQGDETEILFLRRLGASAFQVREPKAAADALSKALALVEGQRDPKRASEALDRVSRQVLEKIAVPAGANAAAAGEARALAQAQSQVNARLAALSRETVEAPPSSSWESYRAGVEALLREQEALDRSAIALSARAGLGDMGPTLTGLELRVSEALRRPERLARLEAELLDRLGLSLQEAGRWDDAAAAFEKAYRRNERLGLTENLARNRRSVAYSFYQLAGLRAEGGEGRAALLRRAEGEFGKVLELLREHGVPERKASKGGALLGLQLEVALDKAGSTQAAQGFTREQEERLAQAFLARIRTELGDLDAAAEPLETQLRQYPRGRAVAPEDAFGVSVLFHRAGQLAAARSRWPEAFERFRRSAELSTGAVGAVLGAANMARAAARAKESGTSPADLLRLRAELAVADRSAAARLRNDEAVRLSALAPWYHDVLGVHWTELAATPADSVEAAARRLDALLEAWAHFGQGLRILDAQGEGASRDRARVALRAGLHLNLAELALELDDRPRAEEHFGLALEASRRGLLPELEWRALAGLGRREEALAALRSVPILRAGCGPHEVEAALGATVAALVREGKAEQALQRAELLSELERVNRLAPLVLGRLSAAERELCRQAAPRLLRIRELRRKLSGARGEERGYLESSLGRETALLEQSLGPDPERLPALARLAGEGAERDRVLLLLGLAVRAEDAAEAAVGAGQGRAEEEARRDWAALVGRYGEIASEGLAAADPEQAPGVLALLTPAPSEAVEVMEAVPEGGTLLRYYRTGPAPAPYALFTVTPDGLEASLGAAAEDVAPPPSRTLYLVYEDPSVFGKNRGAALALSATQLVRAHRGRKPFRRSLLAEGYGGPLPPGFERLDTPPGEKELLEALAGVHTLLLGGRVSLIASVPTRAGERPRRWLGAELSDGREVPVIELARRALQASLVALPGATTEAAYPTVHLFSLFGVPTVVLSEGAASGDEDRNGPVGAFLAAYGEATASEAAGTGGLRLFGFQGMAPEEATAYAREQFTRTVRNAQEALKGGSPEAAGRALAWIRDAILTAREAPELARYLPDLERFARESAFRAGRTEEAAEHARSLVDLLARLSPDSEAHAEAVFRLGLLEVRLERYDRGAARLEEARDMLALLDLPSEQAEATAGLGAALEGATEYDRALAEFQSAAELAGELGKPDLLARQHRNLGRVYDLRLSQYARAKQNYNAALEIYRALGDAAGSAQALLDVGRCLRLLGNFPEASDRYREALELTEGHPGLERLQARIRIEQANNAWFQGRYQEAFELQGAALKLARQNGWPLEEEIARNTAGLLWWTLGDRDKAVRELTDALALAENLEGRRDEVATTLNNLGLVHREAGRYADALGALDRALEIDRALKSRWAVAYDLRNKGLTVLRMGRPAEALPLLAEAADGAAAIGDRVNQAKAQLALGEARLAAGDPGGAEAAFGAALELSRSMALRETEWRCLYGLAQARLSRGAAGEARRLLDEATGVIEGMRAAIKIEQLKDGFLADKAEVYQTLVRLLADQGDPVGAFEAAERSRARGFIDLLGNQRLTLAGAVDQGLYDRQGVLRARMEETEGLLGQAGTDEERATYRGALTRLRDEHRDLLLEIQARSPQLASLVSVDPLKARQLQDLLEEGVALLAYYVLPDEVFCWLVRRDRIELFRTPAGPEPLGDRLLEYRRRLQNLEPADEASLALYRLLLEPVLPSLQGVRYLGVVPHGPLHYLSFATLWDGSDHLVDRFPLFYLPSASVLRYTLERRRAERNDRVLAIGNPDLGDPFLDLPFAEQEVGAIRWNFPEITVLTRERATESWVRRHIGEFGVIHLASHGEFDPVNPLFSAVKLAKDREQDGDLEASEVFGLDIRADLVVLSACQTGLGRVTAGDDVVGLNRAFLYAGTHTLVSSLWRVSDVSTAVLAKQFYREYRSRNKAEALRRATIHVKNRYPHPGYWGAFALTGDYE